MELKLKNHIVMEIGYAKLKPFIKDFDNPDTKYDYEEYRQNLSINLEDYTDETLESLKKKLIKVRIERGAKAAIRLIDLWFDIKNKKIRTVRRIREFDTILTKYLSEVEGHRIYEVDTFDPDEFLCYRVTEIEFKPKEVHSYTTTPARVYMTLVYKQFGIDRQRTVTFYQEDVFGKNTSEILLDFGFQVETPALREQYLKNRTLYMQYRNQVGKQFLATGGGVDNTLDDEEDDERRYRKTTKGRSYVFDSTRVLVDVFMENKAEYEKKTRDDRIDNGVWWWSRYGMKLSKGSRDNDYDEDDEDDNEEYDEEKNVEIPIQPHIIIFDLVKHIRLSVHVAFLKEYIYDEHLDEKLVINPEVKRLIEILVSRKGNEFKDIVKGKSGGTVMLLAGAAGVGKTLTAEVFAEYQKKPLYNVQASQLGLNPEELEEELKKVLERAERWGAILLIDEADVYVHEREKDLNQNAIVGVFLRVLEYYAATVFLTTNRPDIVDDAIISRCVAKVEYQYPTEEEQIRIWDIISKGSDIKIAPEVIEEFVKAHKDYSGRDIKNLIKLSNLKSIADKKPIDVAMIEFVSKFNPSIQKKSVMDIIMKPDGDKEK